MESEIAFGFQVVKFHSSFSSLTNRDTEVLGIELIYALELTLGIRSRASMDKDT